MALDPQVVEIYKNKPAPPTSFNIADMRRNADLTFNDNEEVISIYKFEDRMISSCLPIRIYYPNEKSNLPVMLYFHGGGFVMHNIQSHDSLCRKLSIECDCIVVSVGYRLAPENKYPACIDDGYIALNWVYENAKSFGWNKNKIILSGDSAGATICASLALKSLYKSGPSIYALVLFYGMFGAVDFDSDSMKKYGNGEYVLPKNMAEWCTAQYVPENTDPDDPFLNPGKAKNYSGFPKSLIISGEYDPLRDDSEKFYDLLKNSGNETDLVCIEGVMHGFMLYWNRLDKAKDLIKYINNWLSK